MAEPRRIAISRKSQTNCGGSEYQVLYQVLGTRSGTGKIQLVTLVRAGKKTSTSLGMETSRPNSLQ